MKNFFKILLLSLIIIFVTGISSFKQPQEHDDILSYTVDLNKQNLRLYWKDDKGVNLKNFKNLKQWANSKSEELIFAMNGGMYLKDLTPQGLYIENGIVKSIIDTTHAGYGNFYMQPNGVFYITNDNRGLICETGEFKNVNVKYATQSGPLLLINGALHSKFTKGSKNLHIRNGVGVLPNNKLVFAISNQKINFYDFASYFKSKGRKYALYLDGFVSRTYLPKEGWKDLNGNFGVIIAETEKAN